MRRPCIVHRWTCWTVEILECPDPFVIEVFELHTRLCKRCGTQDEREVILSCESS